MANSEADAPLPSLPDAAIDLLGELVDTAGNPREIATSFSLLQLVDAQCVRTTGDAREIFATFPAGAPVMCHVEILPLGRRVLRADSRGELPKFRMSTVGLSFSSDQSLSGLSINEQGELMLYDENEQVVPDGVEVGSAYQRAKRPKIITRGIADPNRIQLDINWHSIGGSKS